MKKIFNITKITAYWLVISLFCIVAATLALSILNIPGGYKFLVVETGSMEPAVHRMSVIVIKPQSDYKVGEIVTAKRPDLSVSLTHRLYKKDGEKFVTKGDANNAADGTEITKNEILGKVLFSIPFLGFPVSFAKSQLGLILMIIIPAVLIIYSELLSIKKQVKIKIKEKKGTIKYLKV